MILFLNLHLINISDDAVNFHTYYHWTDNQLCYMCHFL